MPPSVWIEIHRAHLAHNLRAVREWVGPAVRVMAVVKANAYGHGAVLAARTFVENGAAALGVTLLEEASELRAAGLEAPLLMFASPLPEQAAEVVRLRLTATLTRREVATALHAAAQAQGTRVKVHVLVDTGLGREGVLPAGVPGFLKFLAGLEGLEVEGVYTHFAPAFAPQRRYLREQWQKFQAVLSALPYPVPLRHACASAALLVLPEAHLEMVRVGTLLYGQYPSPHLPRPLALRPAWTLKTRIIDLRWLPPGSRLGYGSEYVTRRRTLVATLPVGYAHGLSLAPASLYTRPRALVKTLWQRVKGKGETVLVRGRAAPLVGRISMQMCTADVTDVPEVQVGDEVTVPARFVTASPTIPRLPVD